MKSPNYNLTKHASFLTSAITGIPASLSPMLFTTFHKVYGISYTLLGTLVVVNFGTQLIMDLIYSFFSHKINLKWSVKLTPGLVFVGVFIYALAPVFFPANPYIGLVIATIIFSAGNGLAEVLTSPLITSIPSDNPEKLLSRQHSSYAWGLLCVVIFTSAFISIFGGEHWQALTLILSAFPLFTFILMLLSPIPEMETDENAAGSGGAFRNKTTILYLFCIFLAGASEMTMCQWSSSYLEVSLGIPKSVGDIVGLALFGCTLGIGRSLYARTNLNIDKVLVYGSLGTTVCYAVAALSNLPAFGLIACALTGFFASMLWPGTLIAVTERIPGGGVGLFALMAMGGDIGATFFPQAIGFLTDFVMANERLAAWGAGFGLTAEQFGMKVGMTSAILAPLIGTLLFYIGMKSSKKSAVK